MSKVIFNKIDKSVLSTLERVIYSGRIIVVQTSEEAEKAVDYLLSNDILGFDTETRPSFVKGRQYKCSLLQVATPNECFLFRLNYIGLCPAVKRLLADKTVTKVGLAWNNDMMSLRQLGPFEIGEFVDLQNMAREIGIEDQSLVKIYANLFNQRISKSDRLSNWERDVLKESQKVYAAIDAWACIRIYQELLRLNATHDYELIIRIPEEIIENDETSISETGQRG